ncbi:hypothetical protein COB64_04570 [Candidatus Wolfebacteria bacterium]|nr:MAG: hypothetical protein COB64_04570 [Candidatus Wolfebacteria bacterium]
MNIKLGTLNIVFVKDHLDLVARPVSDALSALDGIEEVGVVEIDQDLSDTGNFSEHYEIELNQAANCVIVEAKKGDRRWFAAFVVLGNTRGDVNGLIRKTLEARRVSFAPMDRAVSLAGMEYGAITPIGLPSDWSILIDKAVIDSGYVIIGSGIRKSKLAVSGKFLATLPNVHVLENLGKLSKE